MTERERDILEFTSFSLERNASLRTTSSQMRIRIPARIFLTMDTTRLT